MFDPGSGSVSMWKYRDAGVPAHLGASLAGCDDAPPPAPPGYTEAELAERVAAALETMRVQERAAYSDELRRQQEAATEEIARTVRRFEDERASYFDRVEQQIVRLALSIARKILEREAHVDPTLLGAIVRIALERMQAGPSVRIRVAPGQAERWWASGPGDGSAPSWEVVEDATLSSEACLVETSLGVADFSFDAQIAGVEEAFTHLLAIRPGR